MIKALIHGAKLVRLGLKSLKNVYVFEYLPWLVYTTVGA